MILQLSHWADIRHNFSEEEKEQLRFVITGEAICPRGWSVDEHRLDVALREKLIQAVKKVKEKAVGA